MTRGEKDRRIAEAAKMRGAGDTDSEIANHFQVTITTVYRWLYPAYALRQDETRYRDYLANHSRHLR